MPVVTLASATVAALLVNVFSLTYSMVFDVVEPIGIRSRIDNCRCRMSMVVASRSLTIRLPPDPDAE